MKRILLAEDNPADVYLLREAFSTSTNEELDLTVVADGEQALNFVQRNEKFSELLRPDLIVLDLNLPKNDGTDVLRSIRERDDLSGVPVVILTSSDSPRDRQLAEKLGATSYITKPSDLDAFLNLGRRLLEIAASRNGHRQAGGV